MGQTERRAWKNTSPSVKETAGGDLLFDAGSLTQRSVTTERGGMGRETGGVSEGRGHVYAYG